MKTKPSLILLNIAALLILTTIFAFTQGGPLTPPGAPAPTMKTLDEVEPRIPVNATTAPGNANYHHIITQPGSYYLPGNLEVTLANGIFVDAVGVTIDLMGYEISRFSGAGGNAIQIEEDADACTIQNGAIRGFANGIQINKNLFFGTVSRGGRLSRLTATECSQTGLRAGPAWSLENCLVANNDGSGIITDKGCSLIQCVATENDGPVGIQVADGSVLTECAAYLNTTNFAIAAGSNCTLAQCVASENIGARAISTGIGCTLANCSASSNEVDYGIFANRGCSLTACTARGNIGSGAASYGIYTQDESTITGCTSTENISVNASPTSESGVGIYSQNGSTISNCTAQGNKGDGIRVGTACHVFQNTCDGNGNPSGDGAGVLATGADNRIDSNQATNNDRGFDVDAAGNLIIRNSASGNSTNFDIIAGNDAGPTESAATGTSPFANVAF